jgi:hypothetical protein
MSCGALCSSPLLILFHYLSILAMASIYIKKDMASSTVPSIYLDLAQRLPFDVPTVIFKMRLLNPRIGNFAGHLKGDVVAEQCIEKCDVLFQRSAVWPEDVRN